MDAPKRKRAFTFILITLTLDAMGIGLILPVMPDLIREVNGGTLGTAAIWGGILATTFAVMQFIFGPILGSLSDRYGRRPVLLISLLVMTIDYLVMAVAGSIWLLFLTRVIGGITAATMATASAFIADISKPEEKSANFGLIGAAFGMGFVLGPVVGGLLGEFGTRAPFYAAAALGTANLIFGYYVLPETVTDSIRRPFSLRRANPFGAFKALGQLDGVRRLIFLVFLYEFAFIVYPATWAYFTKEAFGWSPGMVGASLALFGIGIAIVQGVLIRPALRRFGERGTIIYGITFNFLAFVVLTQITTGWVALAFIPLTALGAVVTPALQGLMSQRAGDDQQGELQGVISSAKSMAMIFSPLVMTQLFWAYTNDVGSYFPGAAFALSAGVMIACMMVFLGRPRQTAP
ncbi:putative class C tetracycline resistance protein [Octadecabacter antarcticus 307]|uniref:Putative class C tetracycline resistance protein n=1 Tax=Octadecabacter antarcticus 307 TaxID=391626 RepID=M9RCC7_9RHOB|nr:tetracycline resistance MFS efflux pump [Octadecabacter antarcticus]AGI69413.1 putative class C tetracycline resistance protein [Octadecabacter antarcticus 307]